MEFAIKIGAIYYETSALTDFNNNYKVIFQYCADMIMDKIKKKKKKREKEKEKEKKSCYNIFYPLDKFYSL